MIRILIIVLRGENVGKDLTKSPSQLPERAISVIRLGFAKMRCFAVESCALLAGVGFVKALINNAICVLTSMLLVVN